MKKISIVLACAKGQEETQRIVDHLRSSIIGCEVEIVIASPGYKISNAINIHDHMEGNARAMSMCYGFCTGDLIAWFSDEAIPEAQAFRELSEFVQSHATPFIGEFLVEDTGHPRLDHGVYMSCSVFGKQYARFGMATKETLAYIGGFFDPHFHAHWADPDLGLRCWMRGGIVQTCQAARIHVSHKPDALHQNNQKYFESDKNFFIEKWNKDFPNPSIDWKEWNTSQEFPL